MRIKMFYLLVCLVVFELSARDIEFEYLGLRDGLSQVSVTSMVQDDFGRIWIGTRDGLNVYDGNKIKTFRSVKGDSTSLLGHNLRKLVKDGHYIWTVSYAGISRLNIETLTFEQFPFNGVLSILPYNNKLLLGTTRGLFELNPELGAFVLRTDIFEKNSPVYNLTVDNADILWVGSEDGLFKYDIKGKLTTKVLNAATNIVFSDSKKRIWVGTQNDGVYLIDRQNEVLQHFVHSDTEKSLVHNIVRDICEDSQGNIWIGTFLGLSIIDGISMKIENYQQSEVNRKQLSHNSVYCILKDKQGTMWVGTYFGAISYFNPDFHVFKYYHVRNDNSQGVSYNVIGQMIEDKNDNLWIATEGGGLDYYNRKKNTFTHYRHVEGVAGLSHNSVKSLLLVNNKLLIGTHLGGLNILDIDKQKFTVLKNDPKDSSSISSNIVTAIIPYKDDYLLATHKGILRFNLRAKKFSQFFENKQQQALIGDVIFCLFEDSFGKLWIGTERNGLFCYDPTTKQVKRYVNGDEPNSISNNTINSIFEDHKFRLWIGTLGGGLNQYHRKSDDFTNYSMQSHHMPSNFVYGIQESRYGNLWIATSKGLVNFHIENNRFYSYDQSNGFPLDELNLGALYLTGRGEVFVGGINGMISFKEEDLLKEAGSYNLVFSSLFLNNEEVKPNDGSGLLNKDLAYTEQVVFKPQQDVFTIHYTACNYITTNQSKFEYRLENFNKNWIDAGSNTSVTYTNLDPGTYNLEVRVLNSIDDSIVDSKKLQIVVEPPFYKTWYAYVIYLVLLVGLVAWFNQIYLGRVRLEDSLKAEKREKEQISEVNQSKLRFFTNISHEFRTPLTLITGTLEAVLEDTKTSARNYNRLLTINNNAVRLNNLINELLDFRKMEQGYLKLQVAEYKVASFVGEVFHSFVEYAQFHHIQYEFTTPPESLALWFDANQMEKVYYNLISNAFKVVRDDVGSVIVEVVEQPDHVDITIRDNGPGMEEDKIEKIFDRYYQIDQINGKTSGQGSGIGLALCKGIVKEHQGEILVKSKEGAGTSFTVRLKKGNKHYNEEQLSYINNVISNQEQEIKEYALLDKEEEDVALSENATTLLIVEDNDEARNLIRDIFKKRYRIIEAMDGKEGVEIAIDNQPDLIISDVMMPNMSGTQMCAKLKRNEQTSHIPIILLTARTAIEYKIEGVETGADDYITKPFNIKLLRARVKNLLQSRALLQQKFKEDPKAELKDLTSNSVDQRMLEKARDIVEKHIDDTEFDINDFAKEMGLGRTRLFSKIKGVTGQTPNEFMVSIRLKKAVELLNSQSGMNVSEIAYAVGFNTPRYFGRCFREHYGITPTNYIQNLEEKRDADPDVSSNESE
ncbi:hybrid sensor histidine kinase/response regulator transcription factor [Plebeiibacterium marinum]|uniref:histidine kinase n=1 Tax=Plebeiibacterium marinum TaxID=2992111 RepID=A0AAE3MFJ8_9BACT|nr:hybrid sensor histidine kinase/response regulator transcription factor [Plebeiobacterium marinum]MCW3806646.1 response regulator [Plebeiobacterium marinum]